MLDPTILSALRHVERRVRLQAAFDGAATASVLAAAGVLASVYLFRLGTLSRHGLVRALGVATALTLVWAVVRACMRLSRERIAKQIDRSHRLHDRLGSAIWFAKSAQPTVFEKAALVDAALVARAVDARRAAPLHRPEGLASTGALSALALVVLALHFPTKAPVSAPPPLATPRLVIDREELDPERRAVAELAEEAAATDDPELKSLAEELKRLLDQVDAEQLSRKEVFDRLAELEQKFMKPNDEGDLARQLNALKKAGAELAKEKLTRAAGEALKKEDLQKAKEELEKLAAQAEQLDAAKKERDKEKDQQKNKNLDPAQREDVARALENASKELQAKSLAEEKRRQEENRLKEEQRRLKKQLAERPNDEELKRRLQRNQRQLERLEREKEQRAEAQRQLERLDRQLKEAAEQLRQKMSPEALKQAAEELQKMQNELRKLGNTGRAQLQIAEIKEVLRRMGRSSSSPGGSLGQGQGQAQDGSQKNQAEALKSGKDKKGGRGTMLREFDERAGGEKPSALLLGGEEKSDRLLLLPLGGQGEGQGQPKPGGDDPRGPGGDGSGNQHDPNLMGAATKLKSKRQDTRVEGKEGAGPSRSETILGSAEKGFASRGYKRVFSDYTSVMEEVMQKEQIPPGYRFYIKRYFQLIKPRE